MRIVAPRAFFVHGNADAGLAKALGKTQAADSASNDDHVKSHGRPMAEGNSKNDASVILLITQATGVFCDVATALCLGQRNSGHAIRWVRRRYRTPSQR